MGNGAPRAERAPTFHELKQEFAERLSAIGHESSAAEELPDDVLEKFVGIDESFRPYDVALYTLEHNGASISTERLPVFL